jgi:spore coat protein U-like protein
MKASTKLIIALAASTAMYANATISVSDDNQTSFDIGGQILPECKVNNFSPERSTTLNLASGEAQTTASISLWCNTGQGTARTTYASANNGFMVSEEGQKIAYAIDISGTTNDMRLTSAQTVNQVAGQGVEGAEATRSVKVKPLITGFEYAGVYRDTIEVTVSYE